MNIAFASIYDPLDITRGSGTFYHLCRELERQGHTVIAVGPLSEAAPLVTRVVRSVNWRLGYKYKTYLDPWMVRRWGREASAQLAGQQHDVLVTNDFGIAAHIETGQPVVIYTDAMIPVDYDAADYPPEAGIANIAPLTVRLFQRTVEAGLRRAVRAIFPTESLAAAAQAYGIPAERVGVVPFGANIDDPGVGVAAAKRLDEPLRVLFIGKDWKRKGGDIAYEAVRLLAEVGHAVRLDMIGPEGVPFDGPFVHVHGLLNKAVAAERERFLSLLAGAHVLLLPSQHEGQVIAPLEAAAYGVPTIGYDSEGVRDSVRDGESGLLLPYGASPGSFADALTGLVADGERYQALVQGARAHYDARANWATAVRRLMAQLEAVV